jgi:type VII secretion integral membrane protein EccD
MATAELVRVTVAAPGRNADVALPGTVEVAALLPSLMRHLGESIVDGEPSGGWALRRPDGKALDTGRSLAVQVRDGDTVYLVPGRDQWPEPEYDDLADAIAAGLRRSPRWDGGATLTFGLVVVGFALLAGLYPVLTFHGGGPAPGLAALVMGVLLITLGAVLARAFGALRSGAVLAACALPYAFAGGLLVLAGPMVGAEVGTVAGSLAGRVMLGSATMVAFAVIGHAALSGAGRLFITAIWAGLLGAVGGLVGMWADGPKAAAVLVAVLVIGLVGFPVLAMRIGRLPFPVVPQTAQDLTMTMLPRPGPLNLAVVRTHEALTGLLTGAAIVNVVAALVLAGDSLAASVLVLLAGSLNLLRGRLFTAVAHRLPLLIGGAVGLTVCAAAVVAGLGSDGRLLWGLVAAAVTAALALVTAVTYSRRRPSPYLQRIAEIVDVVLTLFVIPLACSVLGLFGHIRGLAG